MRTRQTTSTRPAPRHTSTSRRGGRRGGAGGTSLLLAALTLIAISAGCTAGAVRPYLRPLPDALRDTLRASPEDVITEIAGLVTVEGLAIRWNSPIEGYLETEWYDVVARRSGSENTLDPERVVRLRFFADPVRQGETELVSEAVLRHMVDPSLPPRELEVMVPPGHGGDQILRRVLDAVRVRFPGASP